ncbi:sulfotransferase domain-containing protein [Lutibacter oceani]|uniref:Sulfotransferase domain-containing protein n=1 Tax=Lutibacter oceani TaxID=1853311 RepID=A0A3D9RUD8_9FLAO|nr:sulfotransferase domain-containing protein [Lutibacter oceani]REE83098.1 sulfotransferase domain-containing protein [Lutibacter oceani]
MQRVVIHSVPRSGSTWLGSIFDSHQHTIYKMQPLFSYAFKDMLSANSTSEEIDTFFLELEKSDDDFLNQTEGKNRGIIPSFNKDVPTSIIYKEVRYHNILNNLLEKDASIKVIGLVRNPFSTISSWLKAPKEFRADLGWEIEKEWKNAPKKNLNKIEEFNGFEKWKEVTKLFLSLKKDNPTQFYLLKYENLLSNKMEEVKKMFEFCELEMQQQTIDFINKSSRVNNRDAYAVFKTKKDDKQWEQELPQFIIDEIKRDVEFKELNKIFKWI